MNECEMTPEREQHLQAVKNYICDLIDKKYRTGQMEHGGNLWEKDVNKEIIPEITDLAIYIATKELGDNFR